MKQQVRIIAGQWKRQLIDFAPIEGLRPTPDRVRETLFNWLMWDIQNSKVLDLCAGSGALSFEALSRGASHVTMIEPNKNQVNYLRKNLQRFQVNHASLISTTAQEAVQKINDEFDIIFLDPPYQLNLWQELSHAVESKIKVQGLIYVEADKDILQLGLPTTWQLEKQMKAGGVFAGLFRKTR